MSWTERTNEVVLEMDGVERELVFSVRGRQMSFLGHVIRRQELEQFSRTGKMEDRKSRGRPTQKYLDGLVRLAGGRMSAAQLLQLTMRRRKWRFMVADVVRDMASR